MDSSEFRSSSPLAVHLKSNQLPEQKDIGPAVATGPMGFYANGWQI
jgi:hypothetical protein